MILLHEMCRIGECIEAESSLMIATGWGMEELGVLIGMRLLFGDDRNVLEFDSGDWLYNIVNCIL